MLYAPKLSDPELESMEETVESAIEQVLVTVEVDSIPFFINREPRRRIASSSKTHSGNRIKLERVRLDSLLSTLKANGFWMCGVSASVNQAGTEPRITVTFKRVRPPFRRSKGNVVIRYLEEKYINTGRLHNVYLFRDRDGTVGIFIRKSAL